MQKQLTQLLKLIDRKKDYLQRCENPKTKDIIKAEINIIENFIDAVQNENPIPKPSTETETLKDEIFKLQGVCLLYGISPHEISRYMINEKSLILDELRADTKENYTRIPEKLKQLTNKQ